MRIAITGCSTGIGAAAVEKLLQLGHEIVAYDLHKPSASVSQWIETDLSNPDSITAAIDQTTGSFDVLINNAGLPPKKDDAALVLQVNFLGFRQFLVSMLDKLNDGASIVNTASRAGAMWRENIEQVNALIALQDQTELDAFIEQQEINHVRAYNLSKEAVIVFTIAEAEAVLQRGMRINSVSPAAVSTAILDDFVEAFGERVAKNIARVGRAGSAEEIADVIVFLALPESRWLKGIDITVDGGMGAINTAEQLKLASALT